MFFSPFFCVYDDRVTRVGAQADRELTAHIDRFLALEPCIDEWLKPDSPRPLVGQSPEDVVATVCVTSRWRSFCKIQLCFRM
jgi:hypothetical protein